ncbi:MAG: hypothetical protein QF463_15280 [Vicinamibacterales bacterium]|jgi:hypothetical protein|nr:hypothetical protein [Acidobacteriota bacterium]MDP6373545.1 hypothetical protein [Vicinamibacterales bacterium]MDP6610426.1 hypothetical protein [Vicinamibacterales bacterium]HAK56028.1 hypothetical protein [Acidobacteriota bacterium]|tara:strand:- start:44 stop:478 length:435 start_codon:yes stop_codon:yes gene_type:complete
MRTRVSIAVVTAFAVALLAPGAGARQEALTEAEYDATMKELRLTVGDAEQHIDSRYWPETEEDGDRLAAMFEQVQGFWSARDVEAAATLAAAGVTASRALSLAASRNEYDATREALSEIRGTCGPCHQSYREETDDGYRIKASD